MASIIQKRRSLHRSLESGQYENHQLKLKLCELQPLANIGSASSMIAHEINNLLTPLGSLSQLALQHLDDAALVEKALTKAMINCRRASAVMESMMSLANGRRQPRESVQVAILVEEVFTCLCRDFSKDRIKIHLDIPPDLYVQVAPLQIEQVLMNLILNAREAMLPRGGTLTIRAATRTPDICIDIIDTGVGIAPDDLKDIFNTFYTTKDSTTHKDECFGTGLGLAFCKTIIDAHQGRIQVSSEPDKGTTFQLFLPDSTND